MKVSKRRSPTQHAYSGWTIENPDHLASQHGSFRSNGGTTYYTAGSEDFRAYIWKVPPAEQLKQQRRPMTTEEWLSGRSGDTRGVFGACPSADG